MTENAQKDLVNSQGNVIVPAWKRQLTEVYTRVVGYLRPISQFSKAKRLEHAQRKDFVIRAE